MKSYLNRAISLAVSYWLVMAVVTANLSHHFDLYIYIQGGMGGGLVLRGA
jgi:hypothetical protein